MIEDPKIQQFKFTSDGTKVFLLIDGELKQYDLSTPWDLSTASYSGIQFTAFY